MPVTVRILGIDPGSRVTGYGIIDCAGNDATLVASGCISVAGQPFNARLRAIFEGVQNLIATHNPGEMAVESVFMHRNADSALKLGQARAAAICAAFSDGCAAELYEYAPRQIKLAVVGKGGAAKTQVQHMVRLLLNIRADLAEDAADALAVALCHAHARRARAMIDRAAGAQS